MMENYQDYEALYTLSEVDLIIPSFLLHMMCITLRHNDQSDFRWQRGKPRRETRETERERTPVVYHDSTCLREKGKKVCD